MSLNKRIAGFVKLGSFLNQFVGSKDDKLLKEMNDVFYDDFIELMRSQKIYNGWYTEENVLNSVKEISRNLNNESLTEWLSLYNFKGNEKRIGIILAGNIPLVGFHDLLCVLISGNIAIVKLSSDDTTLMKMLSRVMVFIDPVFEDKIMFVDRLENFDGIIATGSNNTSRYFDYYFRNYPSIIRKSRHSVGIIDRKDRPNDLKLLGIDIFQYFGLGCRSVSKIYVPRGYVLNYFFEAIFDYKDIINHNKYANNYDYNKSVYLLGKNEILDNGFLLLKEDATLSSPVAVVHYEYYDSIEDLQKQLGSQEDELQCVVSSDNFPIKTVSFGQSQSPELNDYADGVDTLKFLEGLG